MKDTLETNLPEEAGKLEETKKPVETPEIDATADVEANDTAEADAAIAAGKLTKEEILAKLTELVETSVETSRGEVEALKQAYYKIRRNEVEELKKEFIADGGEEKDFTAPADETENKIKDLLTSYKEKRAAILAEEERVKAANYALKLQLIDQLKELCESQDDFNKLYNSFKDIQQRWKEVKAVPQEHFEKLKAKEQENLDAKTVICEQIEAIDFSALKSFKDWEEKNKEVIGLQEKWKTIGFAPKKYNVKIFERFRAACDVYFEKKSEFYKAIKSDMEKNLDAKRALCEKAEALKDSTDWKDTTDKMIALQKEWKTIGPVARKHSDAVWKRFISACDYFFEQKNKNVVSQKSIEQTNLAAKKELIAKIKGMDESLGHDEAIATLKSYMAEWNTIGFVPFKEKDKIYKEYHEAVDQQFDRLKVDQNDRKMQSFRNNLNEMTSGERGKGRLFSERDKLMRMYERMKNELQTYENNIGFLSISSKGGGGLLKEMERKIEKLKEDMALTVKKIDAIDENLE